MTEQPQYYGIAELEEEFGVVRQTLYGAFSREGTNTIVTKGIEVTRHPSDEIETDTLPGNTRWLYTARVLDPKKALAKETERSEVKETVKTPVPEEEKPDLREKWLETIETVEEAKESLASVSEHLEDPDLLEDDELWKLIVEERQSATETLRDSIPRLGRISLEGRSHLQWLTPDESKMLSSLREHNVSPEALTALLEGDDDDDGGEPEEEESESESPSGDTTTDPQEEPDPEPQSRALLYGGYVDPRTIERYQKEFDFDEVVYKDGQRRVYNEAEKVSRGEYDAVFVFIQFASHDQAGELKKAAKQGGARYIPVPHGKSISHAKLAWEGNGYHGSRGDAHVAAAH